MRFWVDNQIKYLQSYGGISQVFDDIEISLGYFNQVKQFRVMKTGMIFVDLFYYYSISFVSLFFLRKRDIVLYSYYLPSFTLFRSDLVKITWLHDLTFEEVADKSLKLKVILFSKKFVLQRSDKIICISEATKLMAIKYYPNLTSKFSVIHNSVPSHLTTGRVVSGDRNGFLFVGKRSGYKNFHGLLEFLAHARVSQRLICFGGGEFNSIEINKIKKHGLAEYVSWADPCTHDLGELYRSSKCLLIPSLREGFGLTVLEAFSNGCPVISFGDQAIKEVGGDAILELSQSSPELAERAIDGYLTSVNENALNQRALSFKGIWQALSLISLVRYEFEKRKYLQNEK